MDAQWSHSEAVLENVRRLNAAASPDLDDVERVLTDGYACVLQTEGERSRLRAQLEELTAAIGDKPNRAEIVEITALVKGIALADDEIEEFRLTLDRLAQKARRLRVA